MGLLDTCWLRCLLAAGLLAPAILSGADKNAPSGPLIRFQSPEKLTFQELVALTAVDPPPPELAAKLERVCSEPFISNEATLSGAKPRAPIIPGIGPVLRIAEWNINRTTRASEVRLALADREGFLAGARANPKLRARDLHTVEEQLHHLQGADIVVLNEIDDGVPRMHYENVSRDLAQALHMNYVFGVEFIELNAIYIGLKKMGVAQPAAEGDPTFGLDASRYLGLEGTAMLSRFPIRAVRTIRLPPEYDWYHDEIKALTERQKLEKWTAEKLFAEGVKRQVRRGSRIALVVDLEVPQSPTGLVTVVCPHLEDYTDPRGRRVQADYLLSQITQISNPVIVAGDFNTMGHNTHPEAGNWLKGLFSFAGPVPGLREAMNPINYVKNLHDPTAADIRVLAHNHEKPLFDDLHRFRFADGGQFEWEGEKNRSFRHRSFRHRGRTLSDSSQRALKGFAPTFFFERTYHGLVGEYKLDWFFIKRPVTGPHKSSAAMQLAPFSSRTLREINTALGKRTSDHCPITVDLPLAASGF